MTEDPWATQSDQITCMAMLEKTPDGRFQAILLDSHRHDPKRKPPEGPEPRRFKAVLEKNPRGWFQATLLDGPVETLQSGDIASLNIIAGSHLVGERVLVRINIQKKTPRG